MFGSGEVFYSLKEVFILLEVKDIKDIKEILAYARRVKNTRLVLMARGEVPREFLQFIRRKHRYREVAVVEEGKYQGSCFKTFEPPLPLSLPINDPVLSSALAASLFLLSPLLLLQREEELEKLLVWRRRGRWKDEYDLLRHIRIGEYAMIDAAGEGIEPEKARQDGEKRFWRIEEKGQVPAVDYLLAAGSLVVVLYRLP